MCGIVFVQGTDKQTKAFQPEKKGCPREDVTEAYKINGMKRVKQNQLYFVFASIQEHLLV